MRAAKLHKKFTWVQFCWLSVAIVLFIAGVYLFIRSDESMNKMARPLGGAMLFAGAINLIVCEVKNREIHGAHWLVADGVIAICLSLFPLMNKMILPIMVPFFFCMWELVSGVLKVMDSAELKHNHMECWRSFAVIGCIEMVSGAISMLKPFDDVVGMSNVIAAIFIIQAFGFALKGIMYHHLVD